MKKIYIVLTILIFGLSAFAQQPIADFAASDITPAVTQTVEFTNNSTGADAFIWTFNPSTVDFLYGSTPNSENPFVKFNDAVNYTVTLVATNSFNGLSDTETKTDYIIIAPYQIGIRQNPSTLYVEVQMRFNDGPLPGPSNKIEDIQFGITWDRSVVNGNKVDIDLVCDNDNDYNLIQEDHPLPWNYGGNGGWDCRNFVLIDGQPPFHPPVNWSLGRWYTVAKLKIYPRTPGQIAEVGVMWTVPSDDYFGNANWDINPIMVVDGTICNLGVLPEDDNMNAVSLPIPTNLHGYVWVGGNGDINDPNNEFDDYSWNHAANWVTECGGVDSYATQPPGIYDDCYIPNVNVEEGGSGCYPRYPKPTIPSEEIATGQDIAVDDGGRIDWMYNKSSDSRVRLISQGNLNIGELSNVSIYQDGQVDIGGDSAWVAHLKIIGDTGVRVKNGGWLNVRDSTYILSDTSLVIEANIDGVGSYINHGPIVYGNNGSAKIQTFVTGTVGDYFMHFVGPTVEDTATGYNNGVRLQQFDMTTLDTYAFEWDASIDPDNGQPWVNVWPFDYGVPLGNGLSLSNYEAGAGTIEMVGKINYDPITYYAQSTANNNLELISNPYSSAIDFDAFAFLGNNENIINNKYYIYDASGSGNWITRVNFTGGQQYLQVGQGFFVETTQSGNITFDTTLRVHNSTDAFRELITNRIKLEVSGGEQGFTDELFIMFLAEATMGYDDNLEAKKWNSYSSGATMIRSIADDGTELAINALDAKKYYQEEVVSVPVHFQCGYDGTYTFDFSGIESFDPGSEIWLEDRKINQNNSYDRSSMQITEDHHMYSFTASPDDAHDRFIIHFFGPSYLPNSVGDNNNPEKLRIYSFENSIYLLNNSNEELKELVVYNLLGQEVLRSNIASQEINQFKLNAPTGYYAVRVLTDQNAYSDKVFIKGN